MRVSEWLHDQRINFETIAHPPAYSAQKRAKYLHIPGKRVAKTVLLASPEDFFLAIVPATCRVDTETLSAILGRPIRLANSREIAEVFRDCEWGAVPPFGSLYGLSTIMDESLEPEAVLVFEGHTHGEAIRMRCFDFEWLERPMRLRFSRR